MRTRLRKFGFDLDNTIVDYSIAVEKYCFDNSLKACQSIEELRKLLQEADYSGRLWQIAQGWLYTDGLSYAKPAHGVLDLCEYLATNNFEMFIVSHKSTHTPVFCGHKPLRDVATNWISNRGLSNYFLETKNIYYEDSRELKIERIKSLNLDYFVDDLVQIFQDPHFPQEIAKFLLSTKPVNLPWIQSVSSFLSIQEILKNEK